METEEGSILEYLRSVLSGLRREHSDLEEDSWYSCPKSGNSSRYFDEADPECDCGADEYNARIDAALEHTRDAEARLTIAEIEEIRDQLTVNFPILAEKLARALYVLRNLESMYDFYETDRLLRYETDRSLRMADELLANPYVRALLE